MNDPEAPLPHTLALFGLICGEAARLHKDDWPAFERYIRERVDELPLDLRQRLKVEIDRILRFVPPNVGHRVN